MGFSFGIDIGGTGIKGAPVDCDSGALIGERYRIPTPSNSTPDAVADVVAEIVDHHGWSGPVGIAMPSVVIDGVVHTAANIDDAWIGVDGRALFADRLGVDVELLNDADAAGLAEMRCGAGRDVAGVVLVITMGTGIGSALFIDGRLVPNTELGHLEFAGESIEAYAAASARDRDGLSWDQWAARVDEFCAVVERLFSPDMMIFGGGASKKAHKWIDSLHTRAARRVADFANSAGIAGAAMAVRSQ